MRYQTHPLLHKILDMRFKEPNVGCSHLEGLNKEVNGGFNIVGFHNADMERSMSEFMRVVEALKSVKAVEGERIKRGRIKKGVRSY